MLNFLWRAGSTPWGHALQLKAFRVSFSRLTDVFVVSCESREFISIYGILGLR
jgi:hypothetical protein